MKLFNTVALEITAQCNRSCKFCPVAYNDRPDERMDEKLISKAIAELHGLDYKGRVEFYIYNEPLKDRPWLLRWLRTFREMVPRSCLMIATNGDYVKSADQLVELYDAGLNQLLINCYSKGLYERRLKWMEELPRADVQEGNVYNYSSPKKRIVQMLDKSDPQTFGTGIFRLVNRAGNIPEFIPALNEPVERMCTKPFRFFNINWKGEALVCCQDFDGDLSFGTLRDSTLVELWNHPVMNTYRTSLLKKDRSLPMCNKCDCHAGSYPHNVPTPDGKLASVNEIERLYAKRRSARMAADVVQVQPAKRKA